MNLLRDRLSSPRSVVFICILCFCNLFVGAAVGVRWMKQEVIPVVLVKPGIVGYVPTDGTSIGNTWSKNEVKPVLLLKPGIVGFEPREGSTIGNTWRRNEVLPIVLVEPSQGGFVPIDLPDTGTTAANTTVPVPVPSQPPTAIRSTPSVIESEIDGDFEGWSGETIFKLTNGQIWQQSEYDYEYEYAYSPKVLIYKTSGGYKMKVEDMEETVAVKRL